MHVYSVLVTMMRVWIVLVGVSHRVVMMQMAMPSSGRNRRFVLVVMVHIVFVLVFVIHRLVGMRVGVTLGEV